MSIKITQPFSFDSKRPNFERDVIDSSSLFASQNPLNLTDGERMSLAANYDVGHIVWDTYTSKHYGVAQSTTGANECVLVELDFTNTTLSGVAYCSTGASDAAKVGTMPGFDLANGQSILLYLYTSNTVVSATLNVNSTGAKPVMVGGSATTTSNFKSGWWLCRYDGTNWNCEPLINDGTLSIKSGTTTISTFTANQSGNSEIKFKEGIGITLIGDTNDNSITISTDSHHVVTDINTVLTAEHQTPLTTYTVQCGLSGVTVEVGDLSVFATESQSYSYENEFVWTKTANESNRYMGLCMTYSTEGRYVFSLTIHDSIRNKTTIHYFGLLVDTPSDATFTFITTCKWPITVRLGGTRLVAYMKMPDDFVGTATLTPMRKRVTSGGSIQSFYHTSGSNPTYTSYSWETDFGTTQNINTIEILSDNDFVDNAPVTSPSSDPNYIHSPFGSYYVNIIGDFGGNLHIGDVLSDDVVNDFFLHTLEKRIEDLEGDMSVVSQVQADWNETSTASLAYIQNKPNIPTIVRSEMYEEIEYADLVAKLSSGGFTKGKKYRITDFVTTTTETNTRSEALVYNHRYDLVVTAISRTELDRHASALPHQGDTYFANADLKRWRIWYDINNDTNKYAWADAQNGKGVIYRMVDEWGNDCPYDFKSIQFKRKFNSNNGSYDPVNGTDEWVFTFHALDLDAQTFVSEDLSLITKAVQIDDNFNTCQGNVIKPAFLDNKPQYLNNIVFINQYSVLNYEYCMCFSNTFGENCVGNTLGNNCTQNEFGDACNLNRLGDGCHDNKFYNLCSGNVLGNTCFRNEFGFSSNNNNLGGNCGSNTFGSCCTNNTFVNNCTYNELGSGCERIKLGNVCWNNTFGEFCKYVEFEESGSDGGYFCSYNIIESGNQHLRIYSVNAQQPSNSNVLKNIYVAQNCFTSNNTYDEITTITRERAYRTTVGRDSNGTLRIYNEDDPVQAQAQADWDESDSTDPSFIQHKPTVSSVTFRYW